MANVKDLILDSAPPLEWYEDKTHPIHALGRYFLGVSEGFLFDQVAVNTTDDKLLTRIYEDIARYWLSKDMFTHQYTEGLESLGFKTYKRMHIDEYYLNIAKAVSLRSSCIKRQYGCVIVNNKEIIATGYNGSPRGEVNCCNVGICKRLHEPHNSGNYDSCNSVHAEQNALISASRKDTLGATLYLYGEEDGTIINAEMCPICKRMAKNAGIKEVVYSDCQNFRKVFLT